MKKQIFITLCISFIAVFTFFSCQKDQVDELAEAQQTTTDDTRYYTPDIGSFSISDRSGYWTTIPAGSVDALQQAIEEADDYGVIYLEAGMHTENNRVTVNKPLKIIGADGAELRIESIDDVATTNPAIHVVNAMGTAIQNIKISAYGEGAVTAVLFDNSPQSAVLSCEIEGFSQGILIEKSDRMALINNTIEGNGADVSANGILVNRGKSTYIAGNHIGNFDLGVWACDEWGTLDNNYFHTNNAGVLLCKYNALFGSTIPNNPDPIGADLTCTGWKLKNNNFAENLYAGLSIRDSANQNLVESNNQYSENAVYDVAIPAFEVIGGILEVPAAYKNTVHATPAVLIKDCGDDNTIIGGTLVDTTVDPC